jgi:hypothetical protein
MHPLKLGRAFPAAIVQAQSPRGNDYIGHIWHEFRLRLAAE